MVFWLRELWKTEVVKETKFIETTADRMMCIAMMKDEEGRRNREEGRRRIKDKG